MDFRRAAAAAIPFAGLLAAVLLTAGGVSAVPGIPTLGHLIHPDHGPIEIRVPSDYPAIQAAINAAQPGDMIFVEAGEYEESLEIRNRDGLTLRGPGANLTVIRSSGTALRIENTPTVHIEGFRFECSAEVVIETESSGLSFWKNVVVADAPSGQARMNFHCLERSEFVRNTFVRPEGASGPFLRLNPNLCSATGTISIRRNLFWTWGKPIVDSTDRAIITQNNLGITTPGEYPEDNLSEFPLFCDPSNGVYTLSPGSPCLPENNPWGRTLGALSVGCGPVGVEAKSWGRLKNAYR
jgi:hypothetical protein